MISVTVHAPFKVRKRRDASVCMGAQLENRYCEFVCLLPDTLSLVALDGLNQILIGLLLVQVRLDLIMHGLGAR